MDTLRLCKSYVDLVLMVSIYRIHYQPRMFLMISLAYNDAYYLQYLDESVIGFRASNDEKYHRDEAEDSRQGHEQYRISGIATDSSGNMVCKFVASDCNMRRRTH